MQLNHHYVHNNARAFIEYIKVVMVHYSNAEAGVHI